MPRITKAEQRALEDTRVQMNKARLFDLMVGAQQVHERTSSQIEVEFVFNREDDWGDKGDVGVKFVYTNITAVFDPPDSDQVSEYKRDQKQTVSIINTNSVVELLHEMEDRLEGMVRAHAFALRQDEERKKILAKLTPRERKLLRV